MNPYLIEEPAVISFSGGRSSGMMLYKIVEANGGILPPDVHVVFANTGKEREETLDFVQRCASEFGVNIIWLQYRWAKKPADRWEIVSHNSAARDGEPFREMVEKEAKALPNPVMRLCTGRLKVRPITAWAAAHGMNDATNIIGYRADEPQRVAKTRANGIDYTFPLYMAAVTKQHVESFWERMPFDLQLPNVRGSTPAGNCDLCFLKSIKILLSMIREDPKRADWWISMEAMPIALKPSGALFRSDRPSYAQLQELAISQSDFGDIVDDFDTRPCGCHD